MSLGNTTTSKSAVSQIQSKIEHASPTGVHVYSFNVLEDQLEDAHALLDKAEGRKSMKVTYSPDHNFIVRYMPGRVHEATIQYWNHALTHALHGLILTPSEPGHPGCEPIGATTFVLGSRKKQADGGVCPTGSDYPSVVLEVGSSESLSQLHTDARLWLEHLAEVNLVVLISIDPPVPPNATPQISVQLWRSVPPIRPPLPGSRPSQQRCANMVQNDDWTQHETALRIPLSDIFGAQIPADYGGHNHVDLNTQWLRQKIINSYP